MRLVLVCSDGGHLTEMKMLLPAFEGHDYCLVTYRCVRTEALASKERAHLIPFIGTNLLRMAWAFLKAFDIILKERADVVITTGAEISIPFCWVGKLLSARIVFIETWSRLHTRSFSGPMVYPVADLFLVQWPSMLELYGPKARCEGGVL